jgi:hypothetical protein
MEVASEDAVKQDAAEEQTMEHEGTSGGETDGVLLPLEDHHVFPVVGGFGIAFQQILHG